MNLQLKGKTAFISGSTSGIGFATAKALLKEGVNVIINGRTQEGVNDAIQKLKSETSNNSVKGIPADFSKHQDIESLIKQLPNLDILINNVGIYKSGSFFEASDKDWYDQFEINVMSGVRLSRYYLPKMLDNNWGRILFISSECATLVPQDLIAYSMTKTALLSISRGLANLTKGTNVTVNSVLPGSTLSEGADNFLKEVALNEKKTKQAVEEEFFSDVRTSSLLQRFASVDEVANTIIYFASPLSSATNGAAIKVDGGSMGGLL
jgi:NAD(P)-dependent dehydrogenase (short-subunit alcohol dehydrogenase family)